MRFTSVADDPMADIGEYDAPEGSKQGRLMRLATSINLDSHITVSYQVPVSLYCHF